MKRTGIRVFKVNRINIPSARILVFVLILTTVNVCFADEMQTRFGMISIVAFNKQGNKVDRGGLFDDYKRIQYLLDDKVINEEIDEVFGQPIPQLIKVFKLSKSDAVFVLFDSGGTMGLCALQVISVDSDGAKFSNIYKDGEGKPTFFHKGDTITVKFKLAKPVKTVVYKNGRLK